MTQPTKPLTAKEIEIKRLNGLLIITSHDLMSLEKKYKEEVERLKKENEYLIDNFKSE